MNQPWGLSGPQFLWIYGAGLAAFLVTPWLLALFARILGTAPPGVPAPELDAYEVGYLTEGAPRAAEVVIGELAVSGALRVDSAGRISRADPARLAAWSAACAHGIAAQAVPDGLRAQQVRRRLAKDPGVVAIGARLRAERLLVARSWITAAWVTALALGLALMIAGALRLAEGAHNHRPIENLVSLYFLTIVFGGVSLVSLARLRPLTTRTIAGSSYLVNLAPGLTAAGGEAALFSIALAGLVAVEDPTLRIALLTGLPSSAGSGGGGCGGGGGGGCGGGCGG